MRNGVKGCTQLEEDENSQKTRVGLILQIQCYESSGNLTGIVCTLL